MKYIKFILLFIVLIYTTGCVSYTELNELGIIDMILIDKINDQYIVTINMLTPKDNDLEKKITYQSSGANLDECLNDLYLSTTKKIYFSNLELMALTTNIQQNDYKEIINLFLNRVDSRNTFSTIIIDNKEKLFEYKSKDINDLININSEENGIVTIKQFDEIIKDILEINISYVPKIKLNEKITIEGYQSIYSQNKALTTKESIGYNFATNNINQAVFISNDIGYKITNSKTKTKVKNNKITLTISLDYQIVTNNSNIKNLQEIEKICINEIKNFINEYLNKNNHNYFYNLIKKYDYKYYNNNNNINLDFEINISANKIKNSNIKGDNIYE